MSDLSEPRPAAAPRLSRREAIQWVMAAAAASALPETALARHAAPATRPARAPGAEAAGYGGDPNLVKTYEPGDLWPLTFTDEQRRTATALADVILPKDKLGPAASELGVPDMVDEWISAPYPQQKGDRPVILDGLAWIEQESTARFKKGFAELSVGDARAICDDICFAPKAKPEFRKAASFFNRFRSLCAGAYYGTPAGWEAIGYVGNTPLPRFDGPPAEVLRILGVTQTVPDA